MTTRNTRFLLVLSALPAALVLACNSGGSEASAPEEPSAEAAAPAGGSAPSDPHAATAPTPAEPGSGEAAGPVEVSATGTNFDPPVTKDRIPVGAWFCDMGTVHYARTDEGDGRCARCGMRLVQ